MKNTPWFVIQEFIVDLSLTCLFAAIVGITALWYTADAREAPLPGSNESSMISPVNVPSAEEQRIIAAGTSTLGTLLPEGLLLKAPEDRSLRLTLDNVITLNSAPSPAWMMVRDAKNENWQDPETCYIELRGVEPEVLHRGDGTTVIHFKKKK